MRAVGGRRIWVRRSSAHVVKAAINRISRKLVRIETHGCLGNLAALCDASRQAAVEVLRIGELVRAGLLHQDAIGFAVRTANRVAPGTCFRTRRGFTGRGCLLRIKEPAIDCVTGLVAR